MLLETRHVAQDGAGTAEWRHNAGTFERARVNTRGQLMAPIVAHLCHIEHWNWGNFPTWHWLTQLTLA